MVISWRSLAGLTIALSLLLQSNMPAQDKPVAAAPQVLSVAPFHLVPGVATKLRIRGAKLDGVNELIFVGLTPPLTITVDAKPGGAPMLKELAPERVGTQLLEVSVALPKETPTGAVPVVLSGPAGKSEPLSLLVVTAESLLLEQEPNNSFRKPQPIELGQTISGRIDGGDDVDVYRFRGKAGEKIRIDLLAARQHSLLDAGVTLFDATGRLLFTLDDVAGTSDPQFPFSLPAEGDYLLSVYDVHGHNGGDFHGYHLQLRRTP